MSTAVKIQVVSSGNQKAFEKAVNALKNPRVLIRRVGVLGMSSGVRRLETVLRQDKDAIRTGQLGRSIRVRPNGDGGNQNTIFTVEDARGEFGTNLKYAAQVHFGGRIDPVNAKALAIPLTAQLKRAQVSPRELPLVTQANLKFIPRRSKGKPGIIGYLLLEAGVEGKLDNSATGTKIKGNTKKKGVLLYALARWVWQRANPFLYFSAEDRRVVNEEIFKQWVEGKGK